MDIKETVAYLGQTREDEAKRDRTKYIYTHDVLDNSALVFPGTTWTLSNTVVAKIISGEINYDDPPISDDEEVMNEFTKGTLWPEQQTIVNTSAGRTKLCEALAHQPCREEKCLLYTLPDNLTPVCREFKLAFQK